jgi:alkylated DNA nucleotide flippase Atl1
MTITLTFEADTPAELDAQVHHYIEGNGGVGTPSTPGPAPEHDDTPRSAADVTNDDYRRAIAAIPKGKVAAYSVVSEAVRGDTRGSQKVAGLAANDPNLGTAYRVVKIDRGIAAGFRRSDGSMQGADEARRLLEADGVEFDVHGRVRAEFILRPEELRELYERQD